MDATLRDAAKEHMVRHGGDTMPISSRAVARTFNVHPATIHRVIDYRRLKTVSRRGALPPSPA